MITFVDNRARQNAAVEDVGPMPDSTEAFGDAWLRERRTAVLRVPSVIVPESSSLLVNPAHPEASEIEIVQLRRFAFDPRLWGVALR